MVLLCFNIMLLTSLRVRLRYVHMKKIPRAFIDIMRGLPYSSNGKESACNTVWYLGREDPLEKRMAIHSSILALRIPWAWWATFHGITKIGHDWAATITTTVRTPDPLYKKVIIIIFLSSFYKHPHDKLILTYFAGWGMSSIMKWYLQIIT